MFPTTGQGGAQTIEDIGALSVLFSTNSASSLRSPYPLKSSTQIISRLKLFEKIRMERVGLVMGMSRVIFGKEEKFVKNKPWLQTSVRVGNEGGLRSGEAHTRFL
jgi:salicylate hydroxylase